MTDILVKRKIVHLTPSFGCGGLEKVIVNLIKHSREAEFEHIVISLSDELSFISALPKGTQTFSLSKKEGYDLHCHLRLFKLLAKIRPDVLHTYNFGTIEYHFMAKCAGVKKLIHADHGFGGDDSNGSNRIRNSIRKSISVLLDRYIVVSEDLKQWAIGKLHLPDKKVALVRNGVPVPPCLSEKTAFGRKNLLTVGRLVPVKNQKRLIDGFSMFLSAVPYEDIVLHIVGDGPCLNDLETHVSTLPDAHQEKIRFHGYSSDPSKYYVDADAFILTSDFEAMPMTALEAMSAGTLCILPNVGGIPDSIPSQSCLAYPGLSTIQVSKILLRWFRMDPTEEQEIRLNAFNLAKHYSVEAMTSRYESMYTER